MELELKYVLTKLMRQSVAEVKSTTILKTVKASSVIDGITLKYNGDGILAVVTVASSRLKTYIDGVIDKDIDLTHASYDTLDELVNYLNTDTDYTATICSGSIGTDPSAPIVSVADVNIKTRDALTKIFEDRTSAEVAEIQEFFDSATIKVLTADPREESEIPCIVIVRNEESEINNNIGDNIEEKEDEDDTTKIITYEGTDFSNSYNIEIWADNTDVREMIYKVCKEALFGYRKYLNTMGLAEQNISGKDQPGVMAEYFSNFIYMSTLTLTGKTLMTREISSTKIGSDIRTAVTPMS